MKFSVENLGRISAAEFDIKPLTVFVGRTNTNKTWTAYSFYGIIRSMTYLMRSGFASADKTLPSSPALDSTVDEVARLTAANLADNILALKSSEGGDSTFTFELSREDVLRSARLGGENVDASLSNEPLARILAVDPAVVERAVATLSYETAQFRSDGRVQSLTFVASKQQLAVYGKLTQGGRFSLTTFSTASDEMTPESIYSQIVVYVRWLTFAVIGEALAFPAERKAMSALWATLDLAPRDTQPKPLLNVPCLDFMKFLQVARQSPTARANRLAKIVAHLEGGIMNGRAEFSGAQEARTFSYKSETGPSVQIHASASLVRALAGFDLYLRQNNLPAIIVIDEPEMNAHPEAQLKLVELFAMLANNGINIVVTTHSPYFLDHLNNLIEGWRLTDIAKASISNKLKLSDPDAFISPDNVSAYLFHEDGSVRSLLSDGVIDVGSFSHETDYLNDLYSEIYRAIQDQ